MNVTVGIPTKNRYDLLAHTLQAVAFQSVKPDHIIIIDDSDQPVDVRTLPQYQFVFELLNRKGITFQLEYGQKKGQHISHQRIQDMANTEWIWRVDDDEIPETNVLEQLLGSASFFPNIGAIGGLVLLPGAAPVPPNMASLITDPNANIQWFTHPVAHVIDVEHLHSTFLYRRGIAKYNLFLSPAAHREETLFTHEILRKGFRVMVDTGATTWHFRAGHGGIRSHSDELYWKDDERLFETQLSEWGINGPRTKYVVLDCGRGDHVLVKKLLPRIKERCERLVAATCYRDIFNGDVEQISIAEARTRLGNLDRYNIYRWCIANNWKNELSKAYEKFFELC